MKNDISNQIFLEMDKVLNPEVVKQASSDVAYLSAMDELNSAASLADDMGLVVLAEAITQVMQKVAGK